MRQRIDAAPGLDVDGERRRRSRGRPAQHWRPRDRQREVSQLPLRHKRPSGGGYGDGDDVFGGDGAGRGGPTGEGWGERVVGAVVRGAFIIDVRTRRWRTRSRKGNTVVDGDGAPQRVGFRGGHQPKGRQRRSVFRHPGLESSGLQSPGHRAVDTQRRERTAALAWWPCAGPARVEAGRSVNRPKVPPSTCLQYNSLDERAELCAPSLVGRRLCRLPHFLGPSSYL